MAVSGSVTQRLRAFLYHLLHGQQRHRVTQALEYLFDALKNSFSFGIVLGVAEEYLPAGEALDGLGVKWQRDSDNVPMLFFLSEKMPFDMACWFLTDEHGIFTLYCLVLPPIHKSKFPEAVSLCNEYATKYRFGRFQLRVSAEQSEANLRFDSTVDLSDGTTAAFLQTFIMSHLLSAGEFLEEPHVRKRLGITRGVNAVTPIRG